MFIKNFRDGFRGKPNFERLELAQYKIDDYFYECSFPNNYSSFVYEMECVSLPPNSTAKCDTLQYQAANAISLKTIAGCLKPKHFFGR